MQRLGSYECVELLGRGGMAVVYKALQPALNRYVALKALLPNTSHGEAWRARFHREAEIVARLDHPNILPTFDYGEADGVPFMVMPLVTGGTLREWLGKSPMLERKLAVFRQVLGALQYAHAQQPAIIHRDVKPTNVLMSESGWPLLADFGIAKIMEPTQENLDSGTRCGTPEYMSPEQSEGRAVDPRTDLYAMGILLYKLLTGRVPFQGKSPIAIMRQQMSESVPPPCSLNAALAPAWDSLMRRALAKDLADRFPHARAMDEAVQAAWREQQRLGEEGATLLAVDPAELYACALRALMQGNWPRVISLCGEILELEHRHKEAAHLLTQAYKALRQQGITWQGFMPSGERADRPPPALLALRDGTRPVRAYVLDVEGCTLGRSREADVILPDTTVSRRHCRIVWGGSAYQVEDLGSSNGTCVNGTAVRSAALRHGDVLHLGDQELEFIEAGSQSGEMANGAVPPPPQVGPPASPRP
jgi:hypothetical protein